MRRLAITLAAGAFALGFAASAGAQAPAKQCFQSTAIRGTQPVGDKQVNIRVNLHDVYRIDLATPCPGLGQPQRVIELSPITGGVMCSGADIRLAAIVQGSRFECVIDHVTKLTPDQIAALPGRERP